MICTRTYTATLRATGGQSYPLSIIDGSVRLSEASAPYVSASLTIARPSASTLAALDPTAGARITLTLTSSPGATRTLDLKLSARLLDTRAARVGINLVSDEQALQEYRLTSATPDVSFWGYQGSARSIAFNVLNRVLGPGFLNSLEAADRPVTTFSALRNLIPVGSFEVNSGTWLATNVVPARSTAWAQVGTSSYEMTPNNMGSNNSFAALDPGLQPGATYTMSAYFRATAAQTGALHSNARRIAVYVQAGTLPIRLLARSAAATNAAGVTRLTMTFTIPDNVTYSEVRLVNGASLGGGVVYYDAVMLTEGNGMETNNITALAYFDGDTVNTSTYLYTWDDAAGLSSSARTPVVERTPDFLTWTPGQSAWEFLTPILQSVGQRLFCDEGRVWRLVDDNYSAPGQIRVASGSNLYEHTDLMSRTATQTDGLPLFCDAVVVRFTWIDQRGIERTRVDIAGATNPTKPYFVERADTAWPGPGTAAYILRRLQARRQQQTATASMDFTARPGQTAVISAAAGTVLSGYLDTVEWNLTADDMTITTKGLVITPTGAWINRTTTWAASTGTWSKQ
jgi:hypothetical protein